MSALPSVQQWVVQQWVVAWVVVLQQVVVWVVVQSVVDLQQQQLLLRSKRPFWAVATRIYVPFAVIAVPSLAASSRLGVMTSILAIAILAPLIDQVLLENLKHRVLRYQYV